MSVSPSFPDQAQTLGALLRAPYEKLAVRLYGGLAERGYPGVRRAHGAVFRHLRPEGSRLTELARAAGMTKQSMAYLVGALERQGYLEIVPDPVDARARQVRLTGSGRGLVEVLLRASRELEQEAARRLGQASLTDLRTQLLALDGALGD